MTITCGTVRFHDPCLVEIFLLCGFDIFLIDHRDYELFTLDPVTSLELFTRLVSLSLVIEIISD